MQHAELPWVEEGLQWAREGLGCVMGEQGGAEGRVARDCRDCFLGGSFLPFPLEAISR